MQNILILYSSTDGQTRLICERIQELSKKKDSCKLVNIDDVEEENIMNYNYIIIGASIRYGKHNKKVFKFIEKYKNELKQKKTAFFSVNVVARKPEKNTAETNPYINKFLKISKWRPSKIKVFAGKVDYPNYNFFDKYIIKFIMFITNGPTDTSQSYEFTDWSKVDDFSEELRNNY